MRRLPLSLTAAQYEEVGAALESEGLRVDRRMQILADGRTLWTTSYTATDATEEECMRLLLVAIRHGANYRRSSWGSITVDTQRTARVERGAA